jgi:hypothetical protein
LDEGRHLLYHVLSIMNHDGGGRGGCAYKFYLATSTKPSNLTNMTPKLTRFLGFMFLQTLVLIQSGEHNVIVFSRLT